MSDPSDSTPRPDADIIARLGLDRLGLDRLGLDKLSRERFPRRHWLVIGIGILGMVLIGWWLFGGSAAPDFTVQEVRRQALSVTVSATGTLAPRDQVDVGAEISGRLDDILVDFNSPVKKGQVLARLNTEQLRAHLDQSRASLASARASAAQAAATLRETSQIRVRTTALSRINAASKQELDSATANFARAQAGIALANSQVRLAEAQVAADQTSLAKATILSPIDGIVLDRKVEVGQTVVAAMTTPVLFTLASDLRQMELDVDIDEADVGAVRAGQTAMFTVDAYPARQFEAKLISVHSAPKTVQGVVTYQGVLLVKNDERVLKPGMTATAEIQAARYPNALVVPNAALRFTPPERYTKDATPAPTGAHTGRVWVRSGSSIEPRDLKLGVTDGRFTEVTSGAIEPGEEVVTDLKAKDGAKSE